LQQQTFAGTESVNVRHIHLSLCTKGGSTTKGRNPQDRLPHPRQAISLPPNLSFCMQSLCGTRPSVQFVPHRGPRGFLRDPLCPPWFIPSPFRPRQKLEFLLRGIFRISIPHLTTLVRSAFAKGWLDTAIRRMFKYLLIFHSKMETVSAASHARSRGYFCAILQFLST